MSSSSVVRRGMLMPAPWLCDEAERDKLMLKEDLGMLELLFWLSQGERNDSGPLPKGKTSEDLSALLLVG